MLFMKENDRNLFRYILEERNLRPWRKNTKNCMNIGELKPDRMEKFNQLAFSGGG